MEYNGTHARMSPSSRRAWIEIKKAANLGAKVRVALLAEGVDRNTILRDDSAKNRVALLAEGVDRNSAVGFGECGNALSPSSRRAWIEIFPCI